MAAPPPPGGENRLRTKSTKETHANPMRTGERNRHRSGVVSEHDRQILRGNVTARTTRGQGDPETVRNETKEEKEEKEEVGHFESAR